VIKPNTLTVSRIVIAIILCVLLVNLRGFWSYLLCFFLFILAAMTDLWDGQLARKLKMESNFGKITDPIADKILILSIFFMFAYKNLYSVWWIVPVTVREILVTAVRFQKLRENRVLAAEWSGKIKTVIQMITILVAFIVLIIKIETPTSHYFQPVHTTMIFFLLLTNFITIYSGITFFKGLRLQS